MRVHYQIRGPGSTGEQPQAGGSPEPGARPSIIFIHGIGSTMRTWAPVMDRLAGDHQVAAIDLLGHGGSPVPEDPSEYGRDRALDDIDELIGLVDGPPVLIGHSLGGYLALAHAATRPGVARGLVVLNTGPGFRDPAKREAWNERSRRNAHRFGVVPQAAELNLQHDSVVMDTIDTMEIPVLVLAGTDDRPEYESAGRYLERKMPQCRFVAVEDGGHTMHEDTHVVQIADLIDAFVRAVG